MLKYRNAKVLNWWLDEILTTYRAAKTKLNCCCAMLLLYYTYIIYQELFLTSNYFGTLLETRCELTDGPTNRPIDMTTYRAAIAAKNVVWWIFLINSETSWGWACPGSVRALLLLHFSDMIFDQVDKLWVGWLGWICWTSCTNTSLFEFRLDH